MQPDRPGNDFNGVLASEGARPGPGSAEPESLAPETNEAWDAGQNSALAMLGGEREGEFDDLAELAAAICPTPVAIILLADAEWLYPKGATGLHLSQTQRAGSFCDYTLRQEQIFTVRDASRDTRFSELALVAQSPGFRFYAGLPLFSPSAHKIGALCVLDTISRDLKAWQADALRKLGHQANVLIELRMRRRLAEKSSGLWQGSAALFAQFTDGIPFACYLKDNEHRLLFYNRKLSERFGISSWEWLGKTSHEIWPGPLADEIRNAEERIFRSGRSGEMQVFLPAKDGRATPWTLYQSVHHSAMGESILAVMLVPAEATQGVTTAPYAATGVGTPGSPALSLARTL